VGGGLRGGVELDEQHADQVGGVALVRRLLDGLFQLRQPLDREHARPRRVELGAGLGPAVTLQREQQLLVRLAPQGGLGGGQLFHRLLGGRVRAAAERDLVRLIEDQGLELRVVLQLGRVLDQRLGEVDGGLGVALRERPLRLLAVQLVEVLLGRPGGRRRAREDGQDGDARDQPPPHSVSFDSREVRRV
jgi:hypothetical protein